MVAIDVLLLLQVPPAVALVSVTGVLIQVVVTPPIVAGVEGGAVTVTVTILEVAEQPDAVTTT
jgi:hypothetical protein